MGFDVHRSTGSSRTVLGAVGNGVGDPQLLGVQDGVHEVLRITEPYKLASRTFKPENTVITIGDVRIGGDEVIVMAGPCSAESEEQVEATAARRQARRRQDPARRRVQAAQLALQLPGTRRRRAEDAARGRRPARPEAHHRSDGDQPDRARRALRRHPAGRRAQHAELLAAARARAGHASRCCSSAASPRRSRSGCCRRSTCWPAATRT